MIVGRLGAGKTVYLRRLRSFQAQQESVYADQPQQDPPSTETIVKACQWFPEQFLTEKWMQIWKRAVLNSLATHILAHRDLRRYVSQEQAESIRYEYGFLLGEFRRPRSIYAELTDIVNGRHSGRQLTAYLDDPAWEDLEDVLAEILRTCPPIFFYLDAVDEEFSHAPMYWLRCQKGLFYQVMRFLRDPAGRAPAHRDLDPRHRDVIGVPVRACAEVPGRTAHPGARLDPEVDRVPAEKLQRLDPSFFMGADDGAGPVEAWLGTPLVHNQARGVHEKVTDYLLRHTRLIPRDIVSLGNAICAEIVRQKAAGRRELSQADLRRVVSRSSKRYGDSQLAQASNQIAADTMPKGAARHGYTEVYTSTVEYLAGIDQQLREIIRCVGVDRFTRRELDGMQDQASTSIRQHHQPTVGAVAERAARLRRAGRRSPLLLPGRHGPVRHPDGRRPLRLPPQHDRQRPDPRDRDPVYPFRRS